MIYKTPTRNMELDLNFDSNMDMDMNMDMNMDSNANASARFLVQFLPENQPYCEHDAYAEHHGNVADLDIETANPYFVEMDTSMSLPSFFRRKQAPQPTNVPSNPPPGPAPLNENKEKESSPAGPAQDTLGPEELKKKAQNARQTARQEEEKKMREERVKNANRKMEKRQRSTEAILEQQRQERMLNDGSREQASNFRNGRKKVVVNPITTLRRTRRLGR